LSVENPVGPPVPEFCQATEERPKVSARITGEEARYILEEDGGRSVALHKVEEGEGEAGPLSGEPGPLAGDAEILARKTAGPEGSPMPLPTRRVGLSLTVIRVPPVESNDIADIRDAGPSLGEDGAGVGVDFGEADGSPTGTLKPKVKSSDS
jgi:hypothetical protein